MKTKYEHFHPTETFSQNKTFIDTLPQIGVKPEWVQNIYFPDVLKNKLREMKKEMFLGRLDLMGIHEMMEGQLISVSRKHAIISCEGSCYFLRDASSKLGTVILRNGLIIPVGSYERPMYSGDFICFGEAPPLTFINPFDSEKTQIRSLAAEKTMMVELGKPMNESFLEKSQELIKKGMVILGRGDVDDVHSDYQSKVSRKHALLRFDDTRFFISDMSSSYGTALIRNGAVHPVGREPIDLIDGDLIKLGDAPTVTFCSSKKLEEELNRTVLISNLPFLSE